MSPFLTRRESLALLGSALALGACRGDGRSVLKVGSQKGGTKALLTASGALDGAPFEVEWSEFPAAQTLLEAVGGGAVDLGVAADAPFLFAYLSGSPIKAVSAQVANPRPSESVALIVPPGSAVRDLAELKGKRVATSRGSIGHFFVLRALEDAALPFDSVRFAFLSPGDAKAAFSSGAVDAWASWTPFLTTALKEGARIVVDGKYLINGYGFEIANDRALLEKRGLISDFLRREAAALQWAKAHVDDFARVLASETGLPLDIARVMAEKNGRSAVPITKQVIEDQEKVVDLFRRAGEVKSMRSISSAFQMNI